VDIAIHVNSLPHQQEHGQWLQRGFKRHGLNAVVTKDKFLIADVHVISGPHFAKDVWKNHPRVLWLDRAYYHQVKSGKWASEDWVSLGWMRSDGGRTFKSGGKRQPPPIKAGRTGNRSIFLADYSGRIDKADTIRLHPARKANQEPLLDALHRHDIAIGYKTSALVTAALEGLRVICKDPRNIMWESNWHELLPYADWNYEEIQSGEAIEHLWQQI
jgi:hypothetical protein